MSRVRGSASAPRFSRVKWAEASTTSGESSSTSTRVIGCVSAAPTVTPLPRPTMATSRGASCSSSGRCATSALREHVAAVRGVGLAVHRERGRAGERLDRHRGRRAFLVVEQRAGLEQRVEVEVLGHERRIEIGAAGQQLAIPRRARHQGQERRWPPPPRPPVARRATGRRASRRRARPPRGNRSRPAASPATRTRGISRKPAASDPDTAPTVLTA